MRECLALSNGGSLRTSDVVAPRPALHFLSRLFSLERVGQGVLFILPVSIKRLVSIVALERRPQKSREDLILGTFMHTIMIGYTRALRNRQICACGTTDL